MAFQAHLRKNLRLATGSFLVAGLFACATYRVAEPSEEPGEKVEHQPAPVESSRFVDPSVPDDTRFTDNVRFTVPEGTEIHVTLSTDINSETSRAGDSLTATTTDAVV